MEHPLPVRHLTNRVPNIRLVTRNLVGVTPAVSGNFANGGWLGTIASNTAASNLYVYAADALGYSGMSAVFLVVFDGDNMEPDAATSNLVILAAKSNPVMPNEFILRRSSVAGKHDTIQAATNLLVGFNLTLGTVIPATPPINVHTDTVTGVGAKFYRMKVE